VSARIAAHLRYRVVGYLALFVALGGTAYATHPGGANTISSVDIQNREVGAQDLAADAVGTTALENGGVGGIDVLDGGVEGVDVGDATLRSVDVANGDLRGLDVSNNQLTGADVNEATLQLATETWHEVGAAGEPPFATGTVGFTAMWQNFDLAHNSAGFYKDRTGTVHLKGLVAFVPVPDCNCVLAHNPVSPWVVFTLPTGYRPASREFQITLQQDRRAAIEVMPDGRVIIELINIDMAKNEWLSLDGVSFRAS
jgi:hypothetical protein